MTDLTSSVLVPLYFLHTAFGASVLAWWFLSQKERKLKNFGLGMAGYALGTICWAILVVTKPADLKPLILIGAIPFLLAHLAYAKAASNKNTLFIVTLFLIIATLVARTFLYPSEPYFSDQGLLFFGLNPIVAVLYIATISISFLPAIQSTVAEIKQKSARSIMGIGLTILYINSIILVGIKDSTILLINGWIMALALIALWVKALTVRR